MIMICSYTPTQKERLERNGYRFVHIAKEFSLYGIAVLRKGE